MTEFNDFLKKWNIMCINPIGNTIILSPLDEYFINEIKLHLSNFINESDRYYEINYLGNTIKIEKND